MDGPTLVDIVERELVARHIKKAEFYAATKISSASFAAASVAEIVGLENIPVVDNTHHAVSAAISGDCKLVHARTSFCCLYDNEKETPQRA